MKSIGIDIGTTTISGVIVDRESRKVLLAKTIQNGSFIKTEHDWERIQDAGLIVEKAKGLLDELLGGCTDVDAIGLTGQMHGIVYVDEKGKSISPLYTWQDGRGSLPVFGGKTLVEKIYEKSRVAVSSGYGLVTHLYNLQENYADGQCGHQQVLSSDSMQEPFQKQVPEESASLCTIADYFGMTLTGRQKPLMHTSMADSIGFFDGQKGEFLKDKLTALGADISILPKVTGNLAVLGEYEGVPVTVALGDNQASFLGSVGMEKETLLVNMGTGGQISVLSGEYFEAPGIEARPYFGGSYLLAGSSLCGGRAYAILENFFRSYLMAERGEEKEQYEVMQRLAEKGLAGLHVMKVTTTFRGTRTEPGLKGSIIDIDEDNFTPEAMVCGVLTGMARELYDLYEQIREGTGIQVKRIVASGNGLRKNRALREIFSRMFEAEVVLAACVEEAAYGAAAGSFLL